MFWGTSDAPNTVVAFTDAQCSACTTAYEVLDGLMREHPGALRIDFRHFPLDRACNDAWPRGGHPESCAAARATEAARGVGGDAGYRKMRTFLYQHRHELDAAPYADWAAELGLDRAAFSAALGSAEVAASVQADVELGKTLGIEAVPAIYLNGRRLRHWKNPATWEALLNASEESHHAATP